MGEGNAASVACAWADDIFFILLFIRSRLMRNLRVEARVPPRKGVLSTLSFLDGLVMFVSARMKLFALRSSRYNFSFSLSLPSPPVQIYTTSSRKTISSLHFIGNLSLYAYLIRPNIDQSFCGGEYRLCVCACTRRLVWTRFIGRRVHETTHCICW